MQKINNKRNLTEKDINIINNTGGGIAFIKQFPNFIVTMKIIIYIIEKELPNI